MAQGKEAAEHLDLRVLYEGNSWAKEGVESKIVQDLQDSCVQGS